MASIVRTLLSLSGVAMASSGIALAQARSVVQGHIIGDAGNAMVGAEVTLPALHRVTRTDSSGRFLLDSLAPGSHLLQVRALGYEPRFARATVFGHDTVSFNLVLDRTTPTLDTLVVRAPRRLFMAYDDFERRRRAGSGRFLTFDQLEPQAGRKLGDILATAGTGVHMVTPHSGIGPRTPIVTRDAFGGSCPMHVFLDYQRVDRFDIDQLNPADIGGVEVYRGPSETPEEFSGLNENCGTLVIWTRMR